MENKVLSDPDIYPTEEVIFSHIGKNKLLWQSVFKFLHTDYPDFSSEWRFYNDGKSWLMKVLHKKKTVFWLSLVDNTFRITFYFPIKAQDKIMGSNLPSELKKNFAGNKNKIRGITTVFSGKNEIEIFKTLLNLKSEIK